MVRGPGAVEGLEAVSIRPEAGRRDCVRDFAVTIHLTDTAEVAAVDLVLSSP